MKTAQQLLDQARHMPLVAILRGLDPASAVAVGEALVESGIRTLEVPLNRPAPCSASNCWPAPCPPMRWWGAAPC